MTTLIHQRVEQAQKGQNPTVLRRMPSGWAVLGDIQVMSGYCLLLPDPVPPDLNALTMERRVEFLRDMTILGDAVLEVTRAARINYEMLGNSEKALHAHIIPRFDAESEELRRGPIWFYDWDKAPRFDPQRHGPLMVMLRAALEKRLGAA